MATGGPMDGFRYNSSNPQNYTVIFPGMAVPGGVFLTMADGGCGWEPHGGMMESLGNALGKGSARAPMAAPSHGVGALGEKGG